MWGSELWLDVRSRKTGVESGFLQFLNTLRFPIQLYVQTRTINIESSIIGYKQRLNETKEKLEKREMNIIG